MRFPDEPIPLIGFRRHVMETREPLMLEDSTPETAERYGNPFVLSGEPTARRCSSRSWSAGARPV